MTVMNPQETQVRKTAPPPRVRRYRNLPEPAPQRRVSTALIAIVVAILITAVGLLYLIQTNHVAGLGYEMSQLQRERAVLQNRNEQLNYTVAGYESLMQVEGIALGQLGMVEADEYVFLSVPRPATDQLVLPEPDADGGPSLLDRIWEGLTGKSTAVSGNPEGGR